MLARPSHPDPTPDQRPAGGAGSQRPEQNEASGELRDAAHRAWCLADPKAKAQAALAIGEQIASASPLIDAARAFHDDLRPGRPALPRLVHPRDVPNRGAGTPAGRVAPAEHGAPPEQPPAVRVAPAANQAGVISAMDLCPA